MEVTVRSFLLILLLTAVFYALNVIAMALPNSHIMNHLMRDVQAGRLAQNYPPNGMGGQLDLWSHCIALSYGLMPEGQQLNAFLGAVQIPRGPMCEGFERYLHNLMAGRPDSAQEWYYRYWGGTALFSRIGLTVGGIDAVNLICSAVLMACVAVFVYQVAKRTNLLFPLVIVFIYAGTSDFLALPLQITHALAHAAFFLGAAIAVSYSHRASYEQIYAGIIAGGIFNL